jgi:hypothetical protein
MKMKPGIYGPDDPEVQDIMDVLKSAYQAQAEVSGLAEPTDDNDSLESIAWNAVVMGHPNRFPDMPETASFARQVVDKLVEGGHLHHDARLYAVYMVAGLLRMLWDRQNLMYLDPEFARGQAGALEQMIEDLNQNWSPAENQPWFSDAEAFPKKVDDALAHIDAQTWDGVYQVLDPTMAEIQQEGIRILEDVGTAYPDALPGIAAYISGVVIVKNTFSPLDGSVPESIGERLTKVYHALDSDNEGRIYPYLMKGFQAVREKEENELDRWRREDL